MSANILLALVLWGLILVVGLIWLDRKTKHFQRKIDKGMKTLQDFVDTLENLK